MSALSAVLHKARKVVANIEDTASTSQPKYSVCTAAVSRLGITSCYLVTLLPDQDQGVEVTHNTAHTAPSPAGQWVIELWPVSSLTQSPPATSILLVLLILLYHNRSLGLLQTQNLTMKTFIQIQSIVFCPNLVFMAQNKV